jgi:butyryl-CoA dehydrogenase
VARLVDAGTPDLVTEASILKLSAADLAMDAADRALQLHGGYGYVRGHVVERLFRDAKLTQIWEGTNEIQRLQISRAFKDTGGHGIRW